MTSNAKCALLAAALTTVVFSAAIAAWLARPVCPVSYDGFYRHWREWGEIQNKSTIVKVAEEAASRAMVLVDQINSQNNKTRWVYKYCVSTELNSLAQQYKPLSTEEACIASMLAADVKG